MRTTAIVVSERYRSTTLSASKLLRLEFFLSLFSIGRIKRVVGNFPRKSGRNSPLFDMARQVRKNVSWCFREDSAANGKDVKRMSDNSNDVDWKIICGRMAGVLVLLAGILFAAGLC